MRIIYNSPAERSIPGARPYAGNQGLLERSEMGMATIMQLPGRVWVAVGGLRCHEQPTSLEAKGRRRRLGQGSCGRGGEGTVR